jgi:hypothetical protein
MKVAGASKWMSIYLTYLYKDGSCRYRSYVTLPQSRNLDAKNSPEAPTIDSRYAHKPKGRSQQGLSRKIVLENFEQVLRQF